MTDDNIVRFPTPESSLQFIGPFQEWRVVFDGRMIPLLSGRQAEDGRVHLSLDHRFGADFSSLEDAHQAVYLIANALAIGQGYPSMYADTKGQPFAAKAHSIASVPKDERHER